VTISLRQSLEANTYPHGLDADFLALAPGLTIPI